jgi:Fe-S-cluster containining protein
MGVCHQKIKQDQLEYVKARGASITCGAGCSFCCQAVYIGASLQECEAIAYYLSRHELQLASFLNKYQGWRDVVTQGGDRFLDCERFFSDMLSKGNSPEKERRFQQLLRRHTKQGISCPFLFDNLCSIYEVRPSNCAGFFVTHSPEKCRPREYYEPKFNLTAIDDVLYDTSFYYKSLAYPAMLYMPVAVFRLLEEGFSYLAKFPGIEGIEKNAMADPEVQDVVNAFRLS